MRRLPLLMSIALGVVLTSCAEDGPADDPSPRTGTNATSHVPRHVVGGVTRLDTPEGEVVIQLVLNKRSMSVGDELAVRLVNRGDAPVLTGLRISAERWSGARWVEIEHHGFWPDVGIVLKPGGSTEAQGWPFGHLPEPGRYRLTKSASYEGGQVDRQLVARAIFEVTR